MDEVIKNRAHRIQISPLKAALIILRDFAYDMRVHPGRVITVWVNALIDPEVQRQLFDIYKSKSSK